MVVFQNRRLSCIISNSIMDRLGGKPFVNVIRNINWLKQWHEKYTVVICDFLARWPLIFHNARIDLSYESFWGRSVSKAMAIPRNRWPCTYKLNFLRWFEHDEAVSALIYLRSKHQIIHCSLKRITRSKYGLLWICIWSSFDLSGILGKWFRLEIGSAYIRAIAWAQM